MKISCGFRLHFFLFFLQISRIDIRNSLQNSISAAGHLNKKTCTTDFKKSLDLSIYWFYDLDYII